MPAERGPDADHDGPRRAGRARPGGRLAASMLAGTCALLAWGGTPTWSTRCRWPNRRGQPGGRRRRTGAPGSGSPTWTAGSCSCTHVLRCRRGEAGSGLDQRRGREPSIARIPAGLPQPCGREARHPASAGPEPRTYHHDEPDVRANGYDNVPGSTNSTTRHWSRTSSGGSSHRTGHRRTSGGVPLHRHRERFLRMGLERGGAAGRSRHLPVGNDLLRPGRSRQPVELQPGELPARAAAAAPDVQARGAGPA